MSREVLRELESFVRGFLESREALIEESEEGLEALLPEPLAEALGSGEHLRLRFGGEAAGDGECQTIDYGMPLMDKMVEMACAAVPVAAGRLEFGYLKSAGFDRLVDERFSFIGARGRVGNQGPTLIDYLHLTLRYTAQSDEQKMGLLDLIFNLETGAFVPEMANGSGPVSRQPLTSPRNEILPAARLAPLQGWVEKLAPRLAADAIAPFIDSMQRRYRRDSASLDEYYQALGREMEGSLERAGLSEQSRLDRREKIDGLAGELARKKDDLLKKYSVRVAFEPAALKLIRTPAVKLLYQLDIGRRRREITMIYNPQTRTLDPLVCEGCGANLLTARFCDRLHLLCPACHGRCPRCG